LPSLQDPEEKDILFLPPIILDDRITLLGGGTEVYRHYTTTYNNIGQVSTYPESRRRIPAHLA